MQKTPQPPPAFDPKMLMSEGPHGVPEGGPQISKCPPKTAVDQAQPREVPPPPAPPQPAAKAEATAAAPESAGAIESFGKGFAKGFIEGLVVGVAFGAAVAVGGPVAVAAGAVGLVLGAAGILGAAATIGQVAVGKDLAGNDLSVAQRAQMAGELSGGLAGGTIGSAGGTRLVGVLKSALGMSSGATAIRLPTKRIRQAIEDLRAGKEVTVKTIDEARAILESMPELRAHTFNQLMLAQRAWRFRGCLEYSNWYLRHDRFVRSMQT